MKKRIAIIGAGISGLTCAQQLKHHADVVVYEKARGVGGRMSTRYADPFYFDHGTQYFTARTKAFQAFLKPSMENGTIAEWSGKVINLEMGKKITKRLWFEPHFVATPNMNSLCKKLAEGLDVRVTVEVAPLAQKQSGVWMLQDKQGNMLGEYDWVISTAPPAQTLALFQVALADNSLLHTSRMQGCYALMIGFNKPWDKQWIAAKVRDNPIKWISINSTKPGRSEEVTAIVVHSSNNWADEHIDDNMDVAQKFLLGQFEAVSGIDCSNADYISTHRWKYAIVEETQKSGFYFDSDQGIAATSDWASTSRIEEVWLNAVGLAEDMISSLVI
jgi:predicted NAD/FAD-dependent oxidoreductase